MSARLPAIRDLIRTARRRVDGHASAGAGGVALLANAIEGLLAEVEDLHAEVRRLNGHPERAQAGKSGVQ